MMSDTNTHQEALRPFILGIAGCSCSGKSTLARELAKEFQATLLPLDLYYRDLGHLPFEDRTRENFDHPDAFEETLLVDHLHALPKHQPVDVPTYDFADYTRVPNRTTRVQPANLIIVEGILALHFSSLRALYNLSVFVEAPLDLCLSRRIHRDTHQRGRTEASVRLQYETTARPMAEQFVLPSAIYANVTVSGTQSLDWSVEQILQRLRQLGVTLPDHHPIQAS